MEMRKHGLDNTWLQSNWGTNAELQESEFRKFLELLSCRQLHLCVMRRFHTCICQYGWIKAVFNQCHVTKLITLHLSRLCYWFPSCKTRKQALCRFSLFGQRNANEGKIHHAILQCFARRMKSRIENRSRFHFTTAVWTKWLLMRFPRQCKKLRKAKFDSFCANQKREWARLEGETIIRQGSNAAQTPTKHGFIADLALLLFCVAKWWPFCSAQKFSAQRTNPRQRPRHFDFSSHFPPGKHQIITLSVQSRYLPTTGSQTLKHPRDVHCRISLGKE